jgi:5'-methylthioadenosine phosphorylase
MGRQYTLAVLGGSGLYQMDGLRDVRQLAIETPYGPPSDAIVEGHLATEAGDVRMLFLPRHGRGHRLPPHAINYRANVAALKMSGATHLLSVSAVGSIREEIQPGDFVVIDQYIDLSRRRISTFFDEIAAHVSFSDPVCDKLASALTSAARAVHAKGERGVHEGGTYVCIDGPQFSTRAESLVYRSWNVSAIGMTSMPEAKLAREAELPFATLALATDYDCWHVSEEAVTVEAIVAVMRKNVDAAKQTVARLAGLLPAPETSRAYGALTGAVMTHEGVASAEARKRLSWLMPL